MCPSLHSSTFPFISAYTEATMLFSRQSTLDDLDDMPQNVPKTSERARPKLRKMYGLDMSNSSMESNSSAISRSLTQLHVLCHSPHRIYHHFFKADSCLKVFFRYRFECHKMSYVTTAHRDTKTRTTQS